MSQDMPISFADQAEAIITSANVGTSEEMLQAIERIEQQLGQWIDQARVDKDITLLFKDYSVLSICEQGNSWLLSIGTWYKPKDLH